MGEQGYYTEQGIGLQLLGQRWYDASVGRFISRDPIGEQGGLNLYEYVRNNAVNEINPEGKNPSLILRAAACAACAYLIYKDVKESWEDYKNIFQKCSEKEDLQEKIECYVIAIFYVIGDQCVENPEDWLKDIACLYCVGGPRIDELLNRIRRLAPIPQPSSYSGYWKIRF